MLKFLSQVMKACVPAVAQKEEEALQRWKEENRAAPVHLNPERLGKPTHKTSPNTNHLQQFV